MRNTTLVWTQRAKQRLVDSVSYIAENFSPFYATAFRDDVMSTVAKIRENSDRGNEAFPEFKLPSFRFRLCASKNWAVYYSIKGNVIEIRSIRHALQNTRTPLDL